jgi:hypothetical protein
LKNICSDVLSKTAKTAPNWLQNQLGGGQEMMKSDKEYQSVI